MLRPHASPISGMLTRERASVRRPIVGPVIVSRLFAPRKTLPSAPLVLMTLRSLLQAYKWISSFFSEEGGSSYIGAFRRLIEGVVVALVAVSGVFCDDWCR